MRQTSTLREMGGGGGGGEKERAKSEKLTSEPAAAQLMRLLLGLAIQKVEVALQRQKVLDRKKRKEFGYWISHK